MVGWVKKTFGSVRAVQEQRIVRVTNRVTLEGALFNELRAARPIDAHGAAPDLRREIESTTGDPFCSPEERTPADVFGRVRGSYSTTASNVAKYDGFHGLVVFDDHDPLVFTPEKVDDYVSVALEWLGKARKVDPEAKYPFLMWNCLRRASLEYRNTYGSNYFYDLHRMHKSLGLEILCSSQAHGFVSLTPIKEKEVVLVGLDLGGPLRRLLTDVLSRYTRDLGVSSFNVAFYMPPTSPTEEDWSRFPVVIRVVDRGEPANRTSDIGAMELYAAPVVSSDPFRIAPILRG